MAEKPPKGIPDTARLSVRADVGFLKTLNALLKSHGLRVRAKACQRGGGVPSWVWVEKTEKNDE